MKRLPLVASFILFIALCVSLALWGMSLFKPVPRQVTAPPQAPRAEVRVDAAAAVFGGRPAAAVATNFQLKGVVMSGTPGESVAILSADGKPAQSIRESKEVVPGVTVKEVHPLYVVLLDGGVSKRVELPESARGQNSMVMGAPPGMPQPGGNVTPLQPPPPGMMMPTPGANPMNPMGVQQPQQAAPEMPQPNQLMPR